MVAIPFPKRFLPDFFDYATGQSTIEFDSEPFYVKQGLVAFESPISR